MRVFSVSILSVHLEGSVSQKVDFGPIFHFMTKSVGIKIVLV